MSAPEASGIERTIAEAQRVLAICNACRYCEGYCAVFPAMERRLSFDARDVHYLANLCHNCGACLYACQYAPPHEFQLNFPRALADARARTYGEYAWPPALAPAFERNGVVVAIVTLLGLALCIAAIAWYAEPARFFAAHSDRDGSFYALVPHAAMASVFGAAFAFAVVACAASAARFWSDLAQRGGGGSDVRSIWDATRDALTLRNLDGGGDGCTYPDPRPSFARRRFHHLTFYGFALCFAATVVAAVYHYAFGWKAPYPFVSVPVILGTIGGLGLIAGPLGLLWLAHRRDPELTGRRQTGMDVGFVVLLFAAGLSGLLLLAFRETRAMGVLLALHLGTVLALFVTLPYGKFVHGIYRFIALTRFHVERRRPLPQLGPE